ncbi:MAG: hypothetical protein ACLQHF_10280 [Terracidiphilus sp.]
MIAPTIDESFPHHWQAEVLPARPAILPARHYVYPQQAEEVERGALEVLIRPALYQGMTSVVPQIAEKKDGALAPEGSSSPVTQAFLATCALGFRDPAVPTGLWSTPDPGKICAVAGGYAYIIDTTAPERFTMIPYRPALRVVPAVEAGLLLFVGHRSILAWGGLAWGRDGQAWESEKLSDEGVAIIAIEGTVLRGTGWEMRTDKENAFAIDLGSGKRLEL